MYVSVDWRPPCDASMHAGISVATTWYATASSNGWWSGCTTRTPHWTRSTAAARRFTRGRSSMTCCHILLTASQQVSCYWVWPQQRYSDSDFEQWHPPPHHSHTPVSFLFCSSSVTFIPCPAFQSSPPISRWSLSPFQWRPSPLVRIGMLCLPSHLPGRAASWNGITLRWPLEPTTLLKVSPKTNIKEQHQCVGDIMTGSQQRVKHKTKIRSKRGNQRCKI